MINEHIFREYDIRGIVNKDLTEDVVERLGKAFGTFMYNRGHKRLAVGRDVRLSSEDFKNVLVRGITSTGMDVLDVGLVPTPVLYFSIVHLNVDGGVMVTGSHNPIDFNGFKMCEGLISVYGQDIQQLKDIILNNNYVTGSGKTESIDVVPEYKDMLKSKFSFDKTLKVVIDAGNGTGGIFAPDLWQDLGLEVVKLYCEPDGNFPNHLPDPTVPKYVQDLRELVIEEKADLGVGYDGDSDRIGAIDDMGRIIYADKLLALYSRDVLAKKAGGTVVFDVKCSQALPEEITKFGGKPIMWKTGHSLLKAKMKEERAPLAGEMSGHMFFADDYFGYDDAFYASGRLMQIIAKSDKKLSEMVDEMPQFVATPEIRVECADDIKFEVIANLTRDFAKNYEVNEIDGARVLFGDGWGLVRASNTQPVLVLRFEARTEQGLNEIIGVFKKAIIKYPAIKFSDSDFSV